MTAMRAILAASFGFALVAMPALASPPLTFFWLSGHWRVQSQDGWTEEFWSSMRGGQMVGVSQSGQGDRPAGFEHMRIVREGDLYVFYGAPNGAAATAFRQVDGSPSCIRRRCLIVFENAAHDYPKRIAYEYRFDRKDELVATISGADPARDSRSWTYKRAP